MVDVIIERLSCTLGKNEVLHDLSHTFKSGRFSAIMGKNGSGKTTLLRCINKQLKTHQGRILVQEKDLSCLSKVDLALLFSFVMQGHESIYEATVFETVLLGRMPYVYWRPSEHDYQVVQKVLRQLQLEPFSETLIQNLSGGERQKVFIARAMAQETKVMLLDEPITYLDLNHQLEIMYLLRKLANEGMNIIMIVHDVNLAISFCDDFLFIKNGLKVAHVDKGGITPTILKHVFDVDLVACHHSEGVFFVPQKKDIGHIDQDNKS